MLALTTLIADITHLSLGLRTTKRRLRMQRLPCSRGKESRIGFKQPPLPLRASAIMISMFSYAMCTSWGERTTSYRGWAALGLQRWKKGRDRPFCKIPISHLRIEETMSERRERIKNLRNR